MLLRKLATSFVSEMINKIAPLITLFYVPRVLGVEAFGYALVGIAIAEVSLTFVSFGYVKSSSREISGYLTPLKPKRISNVLSNVQALRGIQAVFAVAITLLCVALWPGGDRYLSLMMILSIVILVSSLDHTYYPIAKQTYHLFTVVQTIAKLLAMGAILLTVKSSEDAWKYALLALAPGVITAAASFAYATRENRFVRPRIAEMKRIFFDSGQYALALILTTGIDRFDIILSEILGGAHVAGLYSGSARLAHALQQMIMSLAIILYAEALQKSTKKELTMHVQTALQVTLNFVLPVAFGFWFVQNDLLPLLFGDDFAGKGNLAAILVFGGVFNTLALIFGFQVLIVRNAVRTLAIHLGAGLGVGLAAAVTFYPWVGAEGIAYASVGAKAYVAVATIFSCRKHLERVDFRMIVKTLIPTACMVGVLLITKPEGLWATLGIGATLVIVAAVITNRQEIRSRLLS